MQPAHQNVREICVVRDTQQCRPEGETLVALVQDDASVAHIVKRWPTLQPHIKEAIFTLIQAAEMQETWRERQ